jgi:hypothetical protein
MKISNSYCRFVWNNYYHPYQFLFNNSLPNIILCNYLELLIALLYLLKIKYKINLLSDSFFDLEIK